MKSIFNVYTLIAIALSAFLFFLSYQLRQQPVYLFLKVAHQAYNKDELSKMYSAGYINSVKKNYFPLSDSLYSSVAAETIPDDSLFLISLQQMVRLGIHESNQFPTVVYENGDDIVCRLHIKAKENFDVVIRFKKINERYVFHEIANLNLLLDYYPDKRKAFEKI